MLLLIILFTILFGIFNIVSLQNEKFDLDDETLDLKFETLKIKHNLYYQIARKRFEESEREIEKYRNSKLLKTTPVG